MSSFRAGGPGQFATLFTDVTAGILLGEMAGALNAEQRKQLAIIRESGERLLALVSDLRDLTAIEQGRVEVAVDEFDLVTLVQTMAEMVRPLRKVDAAGYTRVCALACARRVVRVVEGARLEIVCAVLNRTQGSNP